VKTNKFKVIRADSEVVYEGHDAPILIWHDAPERISYNVPGLPEVRDGDKITEIQGRT